MTRFILEGEWTGYTSSQRRVGRREIISQKRHDSIRQHGPRAIVYADGTSLIITTRPRVGREKIELINSYGRLIREAESMKQHRCLVADMI